MLLPILILPLVAIYLLLIISPSNKLRLKQISLFFSFLIFFYSIWIWINFSTQFFTFQFYFSIKWINFLNLSITLGLDNLSIFFLLLTTFLFSLCFLYNWNNIYLNLKEYLILLFVIEFFLILIFLSLDLLFFYFFFESILLPMFFLINYWGSKAKKIRAAYLFFFYTLVGSLTFLITIFYIHSINGTLAYPDLLLFTSYTKTEQCLLWLGFFITFASKVPMIPFHLWLPEAHVEAPTSGSIILAGILLKLGIYGFLRFSIILFPLANILFQPLVYTLAIIGIIYPALTAIRQIDLKRIIAYSSISHMNLVVLGVFTISFGSFQGSILQSLSHGFVASGLFFSIGFLYDRYHTRLVTYYSGLTQVMPLFSIYFLFFILSNIAIPGTSNFTGEFLILINVFQTGSNLICILGSTGMVLGGIYSLSLLNKLIYGNLKTKYLYKYSDLTLREFIILFCLTILILQLGIFPNLILNTLI